MSQPPDSRQRTGTTAHPPTSGHQPRWITAVLRANAVLYVGFFGFAFIAVAADISMGEQLEALTKGGQHADVLVGWVSIISLLFAARALAPKPASVG